MWQLHRSAETSCKVLLPLTEPRFPWIKFTQCAPSCLVSGLARSIDEAGGGIRIWWWEVRIYPVLGNTPVEPGAAGPSHRYRKQSCGSTTHWCLWNLCSHTWTWQCQVGDDESQVWYSRNTFAKCIYLFCICMKYIRDKAVTRKTKECLSMSMYTNPSGNLGTWLRGRALSQPSQGPEFNSQHNLFLILKYKWETREVA